MMLTHRWSKEIFKFIPWCLNRTLSILSRWFRFSRGHVVNPIPNQKLSNENIAFQQTWLYLPYPLWFSSLRFWKVVQSLWLLSQNSWYQIKSLDFRYFLWNIKVQSPLVPNIYLQLKFYFLKCEVVTTNTEVMRITLEHFAWHTKLRLNIIWRISTLLFQRNSYIFFSRSNVQSQLLNPPGHHGVHKRESTLYFWMFLRNVCITEPEVYIVLLHQLNVPFYTRFVPFKPFAPN